MSQNYNKDGHFYASQQQQNVQAAAGMALINRNQQMPAQNTFAMLSTDLNKIPQYGSMQFQRPPMQMHRPNYQGQIVYNHQQPRHVGPYMSQAEIFHIAQSQQYQQFQAARGHPQMVLQSPQMPMYPAQFYQPAPAIYSNIPQSVVPRPPTPLSTMNTQPSVAVAEQIPMANVMSSVSAQPQPVVTTTVIPQQQQPQPQQQQQQQQQQQPPPPVQPQPPAPLPEKKASKRLVIKDPNTGRNILDDIPKPGKVEKAPPTPAGLPMVFDKNTAVHYGNSPIWTPPQQQQLQTKTEPQVEQAVQPLQPEPSQQNFDVSQQATPVVSAIIDGPAVIPKQQPKKQMKVLPPPEVEEMQPIQQQPQQQVLREEVVNVPEDVKINSTIETSLVYEPEPKQQELPVEEEEDEIIDVVEVTIEDENVSETLDEVVVDEIIEQVEELSLQPDEVTLPESQQVTLEQEDSVSPPIPTDETDRVAVTKPESPVTVTEIESEAVKPEKVEKAEYEKVLEKYGATLPANLPFNLRQEHQNRVEYSRRQMKDDKDDKENINKKNVQEKTQKNRADQKIDYLKDQWSPANPTGKKFYTLDQLLELGRHVQINERVQVNPAVQHQISSATPFRIEQFLMKFQHQHQHRQHQHNHQVKRLSQQGNKQHMMNKAPHMMMQGPRMSSHNEPIKLASLSLNEEVKLRETENAWRPKHLMKEEAAPEEERQRRKLTEKFRSVLNKLTPENFHVLLQEVRKLNFSKVEYLTACIELMFEKAIAEPNFSVTYAQLCKELSSLSPAEENTTLQFKVLLINQCQSEFEAAHKIKSSKDRSDLLAKESDPVKRDQLREQLEEEDYKMRKRAVGTVRFIGELYKIDLLIIKIMHTCVNLLLDPHKMDEEAVECLCKLLTTVGKKMETQNPDCLRPYFQKLQDMIDGSKKSPLKISSRIKFMIQDLVDLRINRWQPRRNDNNPKTLGQIQREVETEQRNIQIMNYQGGGNMGGNAGGAGQRNKYDRRNQQNMNYKPKELEFNKKIEFSRLGNSEGETQLGRPAFFQQWNTGINKPSSATTTSTQSSHDDDNMGPSSLSMIMPSFGNKSNKDQQYRTNKGSMERDRDRDHDRNRDRYDQPHHNRYNNSGNNNSRYNDSRNNDNRGSGSGSSSMRSRDNSITKTGSFSRHPPGIPMISHQHQHQQQHQQSSSASSSRLSYQSSSSGRGSDIYVSQRSVEKPIVCEEPRTNEERDSLRKEFKNLFDDYKCSLDIEQAVKDIDTILPRSYRWVALHETGIDLFDKKEDDRKLFTQLCIAFYKAKEPRITFTELLKTFTAICDGAVMLELDIGPFVWKYTADYLAPLLIENIFKLNDITSLSVKVKEQNFGEQFLIALLEKLTSKYGRDTARRLWSQSDLKLNQFNVNIDSLPAKHPTLSWLVSGNNWEAAEKSIEDICRRELGDEQIKKHVESVLEEFKTNPDDTNFIRALTAGTIRYSIDWLNDQTLFVVNENKLMNVRRVLRDYLAKKRERELQALFAILRVVNSLEYPQNLLPSIFFQLYDGHIVSGKSFLMWRQDQNPKEQQNKGVALKNLNQFFDHVFEAISDGSSCEED